MASHINAEGGSNQNVNVPASARRKNVPFANIRKHDETYILPTLVAMWDLWLRGSRMEVVVDVGVYLGELKHSLFGQGWNFKGARWQT